MSGGVMDPLSRRGSGRMGGYRPMAEINVTPFVDVMLVLLVVFMITAPLLTVGVKVDLPKTQAPELRGQDEPLAVTVNKEGRIFLQETEIALDQLVPKLQAINQGRLEEAPRIFVRGDGAINYGRVMEVMATINAAGYNRVALVTAPKQK